MASRYTYSEVLKTKETKKEYLESTLYPIVKPNDKDMYIISEAGDRLDLLAHNINDATFYVEAGKQLRIPSDTNTILNDLRKINK